MARYREALCRLCRRESEKLFLKGDRCMSEKCSVEKRKYPPGQHGQRRGKSSEYAMQLREKQKVKNVYGTLESQFRKYFETATRKKGITGEVLLQTLERRLDNVAFRMGFASNRRQARQYVTHWFFKVNGKPVNIPSFLVREGDVVELHDKRKSLQPVMDNMEKAVHRGFSEWLEVDSNNLNGTFKRLPQRDEIPLVAQEQLIVELYSK